MKKIEREKLETAIKSNTIPKINNKCVFLSNSLCLIHNIKPTSCVRFPFRIFESEEKIKIEIAIECPRYLSLKEEIRRNQDLSEIGVENTEKKEIIPEEYSEIESMEVIYSNDEL